MGRAGTQLKSQNKLLSNLKQAFGLISPDSFHSIHLFCCAYPNFVSRP